MKNCLLLFLLINLSQQWSTDEQKAMEAVIDDIWKSVDKEFECYKEGRLTSYPKTAMAWKTPGHVLVCGIFIEATVSNQVCTIEPFDKPATLNSYVVGVNYKEVRKILDSNARDFPHCYVHGSKITCFCIKSRCNGFTRIKAELSWQLYALEHGLQRDVVEHKGMSDDPSFPQSGPNFVNDLKCMIDGIVKMEESGQYSMCFKEKFKRSKNRLCGFQYYDRTVKDYEKYCRQDAVTTTNKIKANIAGISFSDADLQFLLQKTELKKDSWACSFELNALKCVCFGFLCNENDHPVDSTQMLVELKKEAESPTPRGLSTIPDEKRKSFAACVYRRMQANFKVRNFNTIEESKNIKIVEHEHNIISVITAWLFTATVLTLVFGLCFVGWIQPDPVRRPLDLVAWRTSLDQKKPIPMTAKSFGHTSKRNDVEFVSVYDRIALKKNKMVQVDKSMEELAPTAAPSYIDPLKTCPSSSRKVKAKSVKTQQATKGTVTVDTPKAATVNTAQTPKILTKELHTPKKAPSAPPTPIPVQPSTPVPVQAASRSAPQLPVKSVQNKTVNEMTAPSTNKQLSVNKQPSLGPVKSNQNAPPIQINSKESENKMIIMPPQPNPLFSKEKSKEKPVIAVPSKQDAPIIPGAKPAEPQNPHLTVMAPVSMPLFAQSKKHNVN